MSKSSGLKHFFLGPRIRKSEISGEKLPKKIALAVFASDALSAIAYAPGELMYQFMLFGALAGLSYSVPIALCIAFVIVVVIGLYREAITHYPGGGGAYLIAKDNFGIIGGTTAAAALLVDYVLTVSVSVTSGVAQLGALWGGMEPHRVAISAAVIVFIAFVNLRGYRESGRFFAVPTYGFIFMFLVMLAVGGFAYFSGTLQPVASSVVAVSATGGVSLFLVLRAFASGSVAMTGIEAVSNGVPVFREPAVGNARVTLAILGGILVTFLVGATLLIRAYGIIPHNPETLIPELGAAIFSTFFPDGISHLLLFFLTLTLAFILLIAANTAFSALPVLAAVLARDNCLPRQFRNRGDRQVYSIGIVMLTLLAIVPVWVFNARVSPLIPLYGIGVFLTFSLVGWSMVRRALKAPHYSIYVLGGGAIAGAVSTLVLGIFVSTKFFHGGFAVLIVIPLLVWLMHSIRKSYTRYFERLKLEPGRMFHGRPVTNTVVIALGRIDRSALKALNRAQDLVGRKIAVHVAEDEEHEKQIRKAWHDLGTDIPLTVLRSEYNSTAEPILDYIGRLKGKEDAKEAEDPNYIHHLYVVITEVVPLNAAANILHNQTAFFLYEQLRKMPEVTPMLVRYIPEKIPMGERKWGLFKK